MRAHENGRHSQSITFYIGNILNYEALLRLLQVTSVLGDAFVIEFSFGKTKSQHKNSLPLTAARSVDPVYF